MTRARQPRPQAPPLAVTLRAALASDWRTLAALDVLAAGARGSDARRLVHEALRGLRAEGVVLEERVGRAGVEVRILTLPAPRPDGGDDGLDANDREAARVAVAAEDAEREDEPDDYTRLHAALAEGLAALDAPAPPVDQAAPVEAPSRPVNALSAHLAAMGHVEEAREVAGLPPAPKGPGPSSRCAECEVPFAKHGQSPDDGEGHPFTPKRHGGKRAPGHPAYRARQRTRAAVLPDPSRVTVDPALATEASMRAEAQRQRLAAAQALDPDVEELPTASEQTAILDGMAARVEEARQAFPPCIDCGEPDSGSCPEGRCRDCDLEHGMSAGACRECHAWIIREDVGGPFAKQHGAGCSLAEADDWRPRDAAEYAAVRTARYGWAPATAAEPETSRGEAPGEQDHATCDTDDARPDGSGRVPALRVATDRAPGKPRVPRPRAHPVPSADGVDQSASRVGAKDVATAGDVAPPCRPPLCHADDINEPARVRGFARPLCETHRRWVEGAGGTLAAGGLVGVVAQARAGEAC